MEASFSRRVSAWLLVVAGICGCGDDDTSERCTPGAREACMFGDGTAERVCGTDFRWDVCGDVPDGGVTGVTSPDIPWLADGVPAIAPPDLACPAGWREVPAAMDGDLATCDPYPAGGALDCPAGHAHFVGEPGCAPVGSACPDGEFSDSLPADRSIVYVQPGATGGDGSSAASPYGSLTEFSIGGLSPGTIIALSRGTHLGPVRLGRGVALWGACAADTVLTTTEPSESEGVVTLRDAGAELHDLTLADSPRWGVFLGAAISEGLLDGVVVSGMAGHGILAGRGAVLTARTVVVRDTRSRSRDLTIGHGLQVQGGATAEVSRALFEQNRQLGVYAVQSGTTLTLDDVVVRETQSQQSDGTGGRGLSVELGATADVSRALIERNRDLGAFAGGADTTVTLSDVVVRDTEGRQSDGTRGRGVGIQLGAVAEITRALVARNRDVAVFVSGSDTMATLADVVVRDTQGRQSDGLFGRGLHVRDDATAEARRALFQDNRDVGVFGGSTSTTTLSDIVVRDTRGRQSDEAGGRGLELIGGARARATRAVLHDNHEVGVAVAEAGTSVTLTDVVVRDTQSQQSDGTGGRGLNVQGGATAVASRALLERNHDLGVFAGGLGSAAMLNDTVIRDTLGEERDGRGGHALHVREDATAAMARALLERSREVGVVAAGAATTLSLVDTVVRDTRAPSCADDTCVGAGVVGLVGAALSMTRFVIARADTCGVLIAADAGVDLSDGELSEHAIGVCLQVDGYDLDRLMNAVRFTDNGTNLQTTDLPIPELAGIVPTGP